MSPLLLAILRAALRPVNAVVKRPAIPGHRVQTSAAYEASLAEWRERNARIAAAAHADERRKQRHQVWCAQVAAKADALTQTDVDALFEQLEDRRCGLTTPRGEVVSQGSRDDVAVSSVVRDASSRGHGQRVES